jgi:hypothetical protein
MSVMRMLLRINLRSDGALFEGYCVVVNQIACKVTECQACALKHSGRCIVSILAGCGSGYGVNDHAVQRMRMFFKL